MEREYNISSLTLLLGIIGSLFTFAALQKLLGDTLVSANIFNGRDIIDAILTFIISWVSTLLFLLMLTRLLKTGYNFKTSITVGVVISSLLLPIITMLISPAILFGSLNFDINVDYIDILRNLTIGMISITMMWRWDRYDSASKTKR
jgi:hypothetical protein